MAHPSPTKEKLDSFMPLISEEKPMKRKTNEEPLEIETKRAKEDNSQSELMEMETLIRTTKLHPNHAETQEKALSLSILLVDSLYERIYPVANEVIKMIIRAMKLHPNHSNIQRYACVALWKYQNIRNAERVLIINNGGIEMILQAMKLHPIDAYIQKYACRVLWLLGNDDEVLNSAGIEISHMMLKAMKLHPTHADIQHYACKALLKLSIIDDIGTLKIGSEGIEIILQAMNLHPNYHAIQEDSYTILWNLSSLAMNSNQKSRANIEVETIIRIMNLYPNAAGVQNYACRELCVLDYNDYTLDEDVKVLIGNKGGIEMVIRAMKLHPNHADVQKYAYKLLNSIGFGNGN